MGGKNSNDLHRHCDYGPGAERVLFDNREKMVQAVSFNVGDHVLTPWGMGVVAKIIPNYLSESTPGYLVVGEELVANGGVREGTWWSESRVTRLTKKAVEAVTKPAHYDLPGGIQVIDLIRDESFLRGNLLKYVFRAPHKGNELEDLKKAAEYLKWEIERVENGQG